jgi:hypothetical protein
MCKMIATIGLIVGASLFVKFYHKRLPFFLMIISLGIIGASMSMFG